MHIQRDNSVQPVPQAPGPSSAAPATAASASKAPKDPTLKTDAISLTPPRQTESEPAILAQEMQVSLTDTDGFLTFGADDLEALLTGEVTVQKSFILERLANLPEIPDLSFKPPEFDPERKQFVLKGKAEDKILGFVDIGFEIRLAAQDGKLALRMDNGIKRGIAYKILAKQLDKQGVSTQKRNKHLEILPQLDRNIAIPLNKDGTQKAEIKGIQATPEQLHFEITETGELKIRLKDAKVNLSSQMGTQNQAAQTPDTADLKFMLAMDGDLKPHVQILDADIETQIQTEQLSEFVKKPAILSHIQKELGAQNQISIQDLKGELTLGENAKIEAQGHVSIQGEETHHVDTDFELSKTEILGVKLQNTAVSSATLSQVQLSETEIQIQGKDLTLTAEGSIQGQVPESLGEAHFASAGTHSLVLKDGTLDADIEMLSVHGDVTLPAKKEKPEPNTDKKPLNLDITVDQVSANTRVQLGDNTIDASVTEGGIHLQKSETLSVRSDAQIDAKISGSKANGELSGQGLTLEKGQSTPLEAQLDQAQIDGEFTNNKGLSIAGKVAGSVSVVAGADIQVSSVGEIEAHVSTGGGKVKVDGTVKGVDLTLGQDKSVQVKATGLDLTTEVNNPKNKIQIDSKGESAELHALGKALEVTTSQVQSDLDIQIGQNVKVSGQAGDAHLTLNGGNDLSVTAKDADVLTQVGNRQKNIKVDVQAQADVRFDLKGKDQIQIQSQNAKADVDFELTSPKTGEKKVAVDATGGDFILDISKGDIDIAIEEAQFEGDITPNPKLDIDVHNTQASELRFSLKEKQNGSQKTQDIHIESQTPLEGRFAVEDKVETHFENESGFALDVNSGPEGKVKIEVDDLTLAGHINTPKAQADLAGAGDLDLELINHGPVKINYDGQFQGKAGLPEEIQSAFEVDGPVSATIDKKDVDISASGQIVVDNKHTSGTGATLSIPNSREALNISIRGKEFALKLKEGGFVDIKDLKALDLKQAPELGKILKKFESENIQVAYNNLTVGRNGQDVGITLRTEKVDTEYGQVSLGMAINKEGSDLEIPQGHLSFEPNMAFYQLLEKSLSEKFGVNIKGTPSFENGEIKVKGEARTRSGITQLADFSIKATVKDNKLVLDMDKAQVLGVIGTNTTGKVVKHFLDKTDIDIFKKSQMIEISLGDIVKDLSLTRGINFTSLELVENRFEIGFYSSKMDQRIAKLAAKGDTAAMKNLFKTEGIGPLSRESLATLYDAFIKDKDLTLANEMTQQVTQAYLGALDSHQQTELEQALLWIAKNQPAKKADVDDNLALEFFKAHPPTNPKAQERLKALPESFLIQLTQNLDQTLSQGGGWSFITREERRTANQVRQLLGLPENRRPF